MFGRPGFLVLFLCVELYCCRRRRRLLLLLLLLLATVIVTTVFICTCFLLYFYTDILYCCTAIRLISCKCEIKLSVREITVLTSAWAILPANNSNSSSNSCVRAVMLWRRSVAGLSVIVSDERTDCIWLIHSPLTSRDRLRDRYAHHRTWHQRQTCVGGGLVHGADSAPPSAFHHVQCSGRGGERG